MQSQDLFASVPLAAIASFAFVTSITPGPNNLLLAHSGMRFGLRRTLPALGGVYLGCTLLLAICGVGIASVLDAMPSTRTVMGLLGGAYLGWISVKMLRASWTLAGDERPITLKAATALQLVNPKLWWMCAFTIARFAPSSSSSPEAVVVVGAIFMACTVPSLFAYAMLGSSLSRLSASGAARRWVNAALAVATLLTAIGVASGV
jgi:threonine/homoserine/homoserine lactone efflux protein